MNEEKQGLKFNGTGFRTNSQGSFNVNAIKQIPILHEHNITNKSHKNKRLSVAWRIICLMPSL